VIKRNDDTELGNLFNEVDACLCQRDGFENYNESERIAALDAWRDRLIDWSGAIQDSLNEEGLPLHEQNTEDKEWPIRAEKMLTRIDNAILSLAKDPSERTTAEKLYGGG
jgi:hypothetical protein